MADEAVPNSPHGRMSPLRVDTSTALALLVLAAVFIVAGIHLTVSAAVRR